MAKTCYVVANGSKARLFLRNGASRSITLLKELEHPESRLKGSDLTSDKAGHFESRSNSTGRGSFSEATDPRDHELTEFAREVASSLEEGRTHNRFASVVLVSSPHFLGRMKQVMGRQLSRLIDAQMEKDYTGLDESTLTQRLFFA